MAESIWNTAVSGAWNTPGDWTGGVPNSLTADVTISVAGAYTVTLASATTDTVDSVTFNNSSANFDLLGTLALGGTLASFTFDGNDFVLGSAGKLSGGTLNIDTGTLVYQGGTVATADFILGGAASIALGGKTLTLGGSSLLQGYLIGNSTAGSQLVVTGNAVLTDDLTFENKATLVDAGTITQESELTFGVSSSDSNSVIINTGAVYEVTAGTTSEVTGAAAINNAGLFEAIGGLATESTIFRNTGTVLALSGSDLQFDNGGTIGGTLAGAGEIDLAGGLFTVAATAVVNVATFGVFSTAALSGNASVSGGIDLETTGTLELAGHTLSLSGNSLLQGTIAGTGAAGSELIISGNATLGVPGNLYPSGGPEIYNDATLLVTGFAAQDNDSEQLGGTTTDKSTIAIASTGTYDLVSDDVTYNGTGSQIYNGGAGTLINAGLLEATGELAPGGNVDYVGVAFANTGTVLAAVGSVLQFADGGSIGGTLAGAGEIDLTAGSFTLAPTLAVNVATLAVFNSLALTGTLLVGAGADIQLDYSAGVIGGTLAGAGEIDLEAGLFTLASTVVDNLGTLGVFSTAALSANLSSTGGVNLGNAGTLQLKAHTLSLAGNSLLEGTISGTGTAGSELIIAGTAELGVPGNDYSNIPEIGGTATLLVTGFAVQDNDSVQLGGTATDKSTIAIASTGTYDLAADDINYNGAGSQIYTGGAGTVINAGLFESTGTLAPGGNFNAVDVAFSNTGTVLAAAGTDLQFADGGSIGGTLTGTGEIDLGAGVFTLSPTLAINVATFGVLDSVALSGNLSGTGGVFLANGATLALKAHTLSLAGTSSLQGTIAGTGTAGSELIISGTANLGLPGLLYTSGGPEIYNDATLLVTGFAIQENDSEQVGGAATDKSTIAIASTGTYDLVADDINYNGAGSHIYTGGAGTVINAGLFEATGTFAPGNLDYVDVAFSSTGTVLSAAGNDLQFGNGGSIGGTLTGAGEIDLGAGKFTLSTSLAVNVATLGILGSESLSGNLSDPGGLYVGIGATFGLNGHTLTVAGNSTLEGTIAGNGSVGSELLISGTASVSIPGYYYYYYATSVPEIYNDATLLVTGFAIQDNTAEELGVNSIDKSTITIASTGTYDFVTDDTDYNGGVSEIYTGGAGVFINAGLLEATGSLAPGDYDYIQPSFNNTGTVLAAAGNDLLFDGGGSIGGTLAGAGEIDFRSGIFSLSPTLAIDVATLGVLGTVNLGNSRSYSGDLLVSNTGTLELNGFILTLTGSSNLEGVISGNGTAGSEVIIAGTTELGLYATLPEIYNQATLLVTGLAIQDNDSEQLGFSAIDKATIAVASTGTYDLFSDAVDSGTGAQIATGGAGTLFNAGLLEATGIQTSGYADIIYTPVFNTGTISAALGNDLQLEGGGSISGTLAGTGEIDLSGGFFTLSSTLAIKVGTLGIDGSGTASLGGTLSQTTELLIDAGTLELNGHNFTQTSAIFEGGGAVVGPGTITIAGSLAINPISSVFYLADGATLLDLGTIDQTNGQLYLGDGDGAGASLVIGAKAAYTLTPASGVGTSPYSSIEENGATATVTNAGLIYSTEFGAGYFSNQANIIDAVLNSTGTIYSAAQSDLMLDAGGSIAGTLAGAGEIDLEGGFFTLAPTLAINVGTFGEFATAELTGNLTDANVFILSNSGELELNSHSITLSGVSDLEGSSTLAETGTLKITGTDTLSNFYISSGAVLEDAGTITETGNLQLGLAAGDAATLQIDAGAVYNDQAQAGIDYNIYSGGNGSIVNAGLLEFTGYWNGQTNTQVQANINNTGTILENGNDLLLTGTLLNDGVVTIGSAFGVAASSGSGGYTNVDGAILADSGKTGTIVIGTDTYFGAASSVAGQDIVFTSSGISGSGLLIGSLGGFAATVSGFAAGDNIDFEDVLANTFSYANNVLTLSEVSNGSTVVVGSLALSSVTGTISLVSDEAGGTEVILNNTGSSYSNPRAGTTQSNWNGASAAWITAADWSPSGVPGTLATVVFDTGGTYSVSYATTDTIYQLQQDDAGAKLAISSGKLIVEDGGASNGTVALSGGMFDAANGFSFNGQLNQAAAATLEVDAGQLFVDGNASLAGTIISNNGDGSVYLYGANITLGTGFALNGVDAYFDNSITLGNSQTLAVPLDFFAGTLDLNAHNLTISGTGLFSDQYHIEGTGTIVVLGTVDIASLSDNSSANLLDSGTVIETGGVVFGNYSGDTSSILISSGAVYDLLDDTNVYSIADSGTGSLKNAGLLEVTGYGNDVESIYLPVINTGTLLATEGTLALVGGGTLSGTLAGNEIDLAGGDFLLTSLTATVATLQQDGSNLFLGSNITYAGHFIDLTNTNDIYLNTYSLTLAGQADLSDGIEGPGTLKVTGTTNDDGNLGVGGNAVLEVAGTLNLGGNLLQIGLTTGDVGQVNIDAGALLTLTTGGISYYGNDYPGYDESGGVSNSGLLSASPAGDNVIYIAVPAVNNATGTIAVTSGALVFDGGAYNAYNGELTNNGLLTVGSSASLIADAYVNGTVINTGTILVGAGSDVQFYGGGGGTLGGTLAGAGEIDLAGNGTFTLTSLVVSIATLTANYADLILGSNLTYAGTFTDLNSSDDIALNGYNLTLSGQAAISDTISGPGTLKVTGSTSISSAYPYYTEFLSGGAVLEDAKTINLNGNELEIGANYDDSGQVNIDSGAVFNLTSGSVDYYGGNPYGSDTGGITNSGLLAVNPGSGDTAYIEVPLTNNASGTVGVTSGELYVVGALTNSGLVTVSSAGSLTAYIDGPLTNSGKFVLQGAGSQIVGAVINTGSIVVNAADLQMESGGTLGGTLSGTGEIDLTAGSFTLTTLAASIATLNMSGSDVILGSNVTDSGMFIDLDSYDDIALNGYNLTLSGQAAISDPISGPGTLKVTGSTSISSAYPYYTEFLSGGAVLEDAKTINLNDNELEIGASYNDSGQVNIDAGAVFNLTSGSIDYYSGNPYDTDTGGVTNSGLLAVNPGTSDIAYIEVPLTNNATGTVAVTSGELYMVGALTNSGLVTISSTDSLTAFIDGPLTNSGKFILQGGTAQVFGAVTNTGSVIVNSADLQFAAGGTVKGTLAGSGEIDLTSGSFTLTSLAVSIATLNITGSDITLGSSVTYAGDFIDLGYTDTIALNAHNLTLSGQTNIDDVLAGSGTLKISGTASIGATTPYYQEVLTSGAVLEDAGTINLNAGNLTIGANYYDSGQVNIDAGAVFNLTNGNISYYAGNANGTNTGGITNSGVLAVNPGSGNTAYIQVPLTNNATGTVAVTSGELYLVGAVTNSGLVTISSTDSLTAYIDGPLTNSGKVILQGGAAQVLGPVTNTGSVIVNSADLQFAAGGTVKGTLAGSGEIDLTSGSFTLTSLAVSIATLNITGSNVTLGSTLAYGGDFIDLADTDTIALNTHSLTLSGQANLEDVLAGPGTLKVTGAASIGAIAPNYQEVLTGGAVLEDAGTINLNAGNLMIGANYSDSGQVNIDAGAVFNLTSGSVGYYGGNYYGYETGGILNSGLLSVNAGSGDTAYIDVPLTNNATGTIVAASGELYISGPVSNSGNGTLTGGTWEATTTGTAAGTLDLSVDPVVTVDAANIILSGANSEIITGSASPATIESALLSITATGKLQNLAGHIYASTNTIANAGSIVLGGGLFAPADVKNAATIIGYGTLGAVVQNTGKIIAGGGTLVVAGSVTGAGTLVIGALSDLVLQTSIASTQLVSFTGTSEILTLGSPSTMLGTISGITLGDTIDIASGSVTSDTISGTKLLITLAGGSIVTETLAATLTNDTFAITSDGNGGSDLGLYHAAIATLTPATIQFGQHHVGDVVTSGLTLANTQVADGYSEKLDASFAGASAGVTDTGSVTLLAAGSTASGSLTVGLTTGTAGTIAGTAVVTLSSDGTGVDGSLPYGIGADTIAVSGTLFNEATAALSGTTLALGAHHVGSTVTGFITLTNSAAAGSLSEALDASISGTSFIAGSFTDSGSIVTLSAGGTNGTSLAVKLATATAGSISGIVTLGLQSDGAGIDTLGVTSLVSQTVTVTGTAYNYATAAVASSTINFGVVHTGQSLTEYLTLSNSAGSLYSEALDAGFTTLTGSFTDGGSVAGLAAGVTNSGSLHLGIVDTLSGTLSGTALLSLTSDGTGIDGLGTTVLAGKTITLTGTVDNYATAALAKLSGAGTLSGTGSSVTLNLGTVQQGTASLTAMLEALNSATGTADLLAGGFTISNTGTAFSNTGFAAFTGLKAGGTAALDGITLSGTNVGTFSELITLSSTGSNASGYSGSLANITLDVIGTVLPPVVTTYALTTSADTISGVSPDFIIAQTGQLSAGDMINAGGGSNTLVLQGGGVFDMRAPATLTGISVVDAQEGVGTNVQTLYLDSGFTGTISAASGTAGSSFIVYGNTDSAHITLGTGNDIIYLGSANEQVNGGGGNDIFYVTTLDNGATINGGAGVNTLATSGAGTFTLGSNITSITSVIIGTPGSTLVSDLVLPTAIAATETISFTGTSEILTLDQPATMLGTISGITFGDAIDIAGTTVTSATLTGNKLAVTLTGGGVVTETLATTLSGARFGIASDGATGSKLTLYQEAVAGPATPNPLAFGNHHVGSTVTSYLTISNIALTGTYSEKLDGSFAGHTGSITTSGSLTTLAVGTISTRSLLVGLVTTTAGSIAGSAVITLSSDGSGTDGDAATGIGTETVAVTGAVYNYATAALASSIVNFGIVHTGQSLTEFVTLSNSAGTLYSEALDAGFTTLSGSFTDGGSVSLLAAGATNSGSLGIGIIDTIAGVLSGTAVVSLTSDGTVVDGLGTTTLASKTVTLTGTVDNYATAGLQVLSGGTLSGSGTSLTLSLGSIQQATGSLTASLEALNSATGLADLLGGGFTISNASGAFSNSGFAAFSGIAAAGTTAADGIILSGTNAGTFSELITLSSTGSNASGYSGSLANITLDVIGTILPHPSTYTLTSGADTFAAAGNSTFIASAGQLSAGDVINGGTGSNTLVLQGGGTFDMRLPTTLANIQIVDAQENTGSLVQTLYLDAGFTGTVIAASGTTGSSFIVYGNTDSAHITLGTGNDLVYLGSASEQVNGGGGNDIFNVTSGDIGATINGGIGANTLVANGGGSFAMGANITSISSVILNDQGTQASSFTANTIANLAITGGNGSDVITLGAASQSVTTGTGNTVIDATTAQAGALIVDNGSATLNLTGGGNATLNSNDSFLTVSLSSATNLMLSPMSFITAIGSSGADTITALATQQTLTGGAGADTLVGYSGFGDLFADTISGLNGDTIKGFGGNDLIDISNLARANATLSYSGTATAGTLIVSQTGVGVVSTISFASGINLSASLFHLSSDGRGGTYIG